MDQFEKLGFTQQEYERNRESLVKDMALQLIEPVSAEIFQKSEQERAEVYAAKMAWREMMRSHGLTKRCGRVNLEK